jgi:hypothetical protein
VRRSYEKHTKKPNKDFSQKLCTGNQSVIANVHILTRLQLRSDLCSIDFDDELALGTFFERTLQIFTNSYLHRKLLNFFKKQLRL